MHELLFPVAAVLVMFFMLIPALTWVSRVVLAWRRRQVRRWAGFGSEITFAWLVAPTLAPLLWLTSSALHQSEGSASSDCCLVDHAGATGCVDSMLLLGALLGLIVVMVGFRAWREQPRQKSMGHTSDASLTRRVAAIVQSDPHLSGLRVQVAEHAPEPVYTVGLLRAYVVLNASFARDADDALLRAALLHEYAHIRGFDTLRAFAVRFCLSINPAGSLLNPDFERWRNAREAQCDGEAVHWGGEPLALAEGIVRAARFHRSLYSAPACSALCGHDRDTLKLRVALLLDGPPLPIHTLGHVALGLLLAVAVITPHFGDVGALQHFHLEVERWIHTLV